MIDELNFDKVMVIKPNASQLLTLHIGVSFKAGLINFFKAMHAQQYQVRVNSPRALDQGHICYQPLPGTDSNWENGRS